MSRRTTDPGEAALRAIGLVVWAVVGAPTLWGFVRGAPPRPLWLGLYAAFAVAFVRATDERATRRARAAALAVESASAIALAAIGMPHFEGALLAVVAAELPAVVSLRAAVAWAAMQALPLAAIILPTHGAGGTLKATGEYAAFSAFAMAVVHLRAR
ncbi:MAG TPA: hypothetical protein VHB21_25890, partial [Minicystis sp.]|nr:hypothetical protein [Minicystis sp.]